MATPLTERLPAFRDVTESAWHETYDNVVALGRWLVEEHGFSARELLGYFGKPWNWGDEWKEYQSARDSTT